MNDGLYRVMYKDICAGFVVERGRVTLCAPILRRRLAFWHSIASQIREGGDTVDEKRPEKQIIIEDPPEEEETEDEEDDTDEEEDDENA